MKNKMKAWRKHNSTNFVRSNPKFKLVSKFDRRTRYTSEEKEISKTLLSLIFNFYKQLRV